MSRLLGDRILLDADGLLGPSPRYIIWFHGCSRNCPGCIAIDWNKKKQPEFDISIQTVVQMIKNADGIEGITVSGGEPFLQTEALYELVSELRHFGFGIIIYSGYELSELKKMDDKKVNATLEMTDVLIDGRYKKDSDDDMPYRGSSNQTIYQFTCRYKDFFLSRQSRTSRIDRKDGQELLTGIPDSITKNLWNNTKKLNGLGT